MECPDDETFAELLGQALQGDRAIAIETHLDTCADCRRHVSDLVRAPLALGSAPNDGAAAAHVQSFGGRYLPLRSLGRGGMGKVMLAYDPELGRRVAVKLLRARADGDQASHARLRREAQAMARLAHPNVVPVFDLGIDGDRVFVAMELVEGATLATWARERTAAEILAACIDAGRGVAAAHAMGLVHRDLTPRNVLVGLDGRARVTDFGLVQIAGDPDRPLGEAEIAGDLEQLTRTGEFLGTPAFASPEAFRGGPVDERSDQWSLAATAWSALYDQLPFGASSFRELSEAVTHGRIDEPRSHRDVPAYVQRALRRAMSVDPAARFRSIDEMITTLARRPGRWVIGAATLAIAALGVVGLFALRAPGGACDVPTTAAWSSTARQSVEAAFARSARPLARDQFERVDRAFTSYTQQWLTQSAAVCEARQAPAVRRLREDCLADHLAALTALRDELAKPVDDKTLEAAVVAALSLPSLDACADVTALTRKGPSENPVLAASLAATFAKIDALHALGRYDEARALARTAVDTARLPGLASQLADALYLRGDAEESAGDPAAARKTLEEAGRAAAAIHDDRAIARSWIEVLYLSAEEERPRDALAMLPLVTAAVERTGDPEIEARFLGMQGVVLEGVDRLQEAKASYARSLELLEHKLGPVHLDVATAQLNFATLLYRLDETDRANALQARGIATLEQLLGPDHPLVGRALANSGHALADLRRWSEAEAALARAQAILERTYAPDQLELAWLLRDIAHMWFVRREWSKARFYYQRALPVFEATMPDSGQVAGLHANIGRSFAEQGDCEAARPELERALDLETRAYGPEHILLADPLLDLARCTVAKRPREVTALVDRALALTGEHVDPIDIADRKFLAAKLLSPSQHERARQLAIDARDAYRHGGALYVTDRAEVERWLASSRAGGDPD